MNRAFFVKCFTRKKNKNEEEEKEDNNKDSSDCHWWTCMCSTYDIDEDYKKKRNAKGNSNKTPPKEGNENKSDEKEGTGKKSDEKKETDDKSNEKKENELPNQLVVFEVQPPWVRSKRDQKLCKTVMETKGFKRMNMNSESGRIAVEGAIDMMALAETIRKILKKNVRIIRHSTPIQDDTVEQVFDYGTNPTNPVGHDYGGVNEIQEQRTEQVFDYGTYPYSVGHTSDWGSVFDNLPTPTAPPLYEGSFS